MGELAGADVVVDPAELEGEEPKGTNAERNLAVLQEFAARKPEGKPMRVVFRFFRSPVAILGEERAEGIDLVRNEPDAKERAPPPSTRASPSAEPRSSSTTAGWRSTRSSAPPVRRPAGRA